MASYELTLLARVLPKNELAAILKRTANSIFEKGGIIRRIDNLGLRRIPYKTSSHDAVHREANYFVLEFSAPPGRLNELTEEYNRDIDIIRNRIYKVTAADLAPECTLEEELKPAPYRSEVMKLIEDIKKKEEKLKSKKFKYNTGLDYYPFQK